nr:hypothetical protein Cplu_243 [Cedratvirus plubellavi]
MSRKQPRLIKNILAEIRQCPDYKTKLGITDAFIVDCAWEDIQNGTHAKQSAHNKAADNKLYRQIWNKLYLVQEE